MFPSLHLHIFIYINDDEAQGNSAGRIKKAAPVSTERLEETFMNGIIIPSSSPMSMSSREIAELTGKQHLHVRRDVRKMLADLNMDEKGYVQNWIDPQNGQKYEEYALPKDLTITLIAGYRSDLRLKIVRRWMELEDQTAAPRAVPQSFREALLLAADQQEQIERQQAEIAVKDATIGRISAAPDDMGIRDAGRALEVGQDRIKTFLIRKGWACIQGGKPRPAHYGLTMGYTRLVERIYPDRFTGEDRIAKDFKITQKGITRMSELLAQGKF